MERRVTTCLLLAGEFLVWDVCRQVGVQHSAEGQAVIPAAAEVCDVNVLKKQGRNFKKKKKCAELSPEYRPAAFISPHS